MDVDRLWIEGVLSSIPFFVVGASASDFMGLKQKKGCHPRKMDGFPLLLMKLGLARKLCRIQ